MEENRARSPKPGGGRGVEHLLDHLLMTETLQDHERRLEILLQKVDSLLRELSILDEVFGGQGEGETSTDPRPVVYLRAFFKLLERLSRAIESEEYLTHEP